jgi:hypothetical protein
MVANCKGMDGKNASGTPHRCRILKGVLKTWDYGERLYLLWLRYSSTIFIHSEEPKKLKQ